MAEFSVEPTTGTVPLSVSFTDLSSGDPETREWDLGDGKTLTGQNLLYTYEAPGVYRLAHREQPVWIRYGHKDCSHPCDIPG